MKPADTGAPLPPPRRGQTRTSMRAAHMCSWPTRTCEVSLPHLTGGSESTFMRGLSSQAHLGALRRRTQVGHRCADTSTRASPANAKSATLPQGVEIVMLH